MKNSRSEYSDSSSFRDKTVVVTGATGGIGKRVTRTLASAGCRLVISGRCPVKLTALQAECENLNPQVSIKKQVVDFGDVRTIDNIAAEGLLEEAIDGLVLIYPSIPKSPEAIPSPSEWRDALNLCFVNPLAILRAGISSMRPGGRIVIVSGIASVQVFPNLAFSNVIRSAWLAEAKTIAHRIGPQKISINTVSLGGTLTERFQASLANQTHVSAWDESPSNIPLGEYGDPDDAANLIVTLLSRFSNHVTGTNLIFDGGFSRSY